MRPQVKVSVMADLLLKLILGPLLLLQGWHTRRVTPRLPEPGGDRHGEQGSGPPLRLLIAGDSSAAGVGVAEQSQALAGQLAERLARHSHLHWQLIARSGVDTLELTELLQAEPPRQFDAALLLVGVNDVTASRSAGAWLEAFEQLLELVRNRFGVRRLIVFPVPPMHLFPALPQPLRWYLGLRARRFNQGLMELVERRPDCELVGPLPLAGPLMAADGFHPGAEIYTLWADRVAALLRPQPEQAFQQEKAT